MSDTDYKPSLGGYLPGNAGAVPDPNVSIKQDPPTGEETKKQAMLFQPTNAAVMAGVVGVGGWDSCAWADWQRNGSLPGPHSCGTPGLFTNAGINGLPTAWPGQYTYFRRILNDPSIRFVRMLAYAPILASKWSVKACKDAPKEAADAIFTMFDSLRLQFFDDAVRGMDYGWAPFEQVFEMVEAGPNAGMFWLSKLKPLLHDVTTIYLTGNGAFAGFNNNGNVVDPVKSLLYTYDGESGNLYGRGRCMNMLEIVPWWRDANEGALRYDRKIAGVFMICHYPPGQSIDRQGNLVENWVIAQQMLDSVSAGKPIAVCNEFAGEMEDRFLTNISMADRTRWKIELLEDNGSRQPGFGDRLAYLDRQKARGWLVPERSAFEAQKSGSKADSESHGDIILVQANVQKQVLAQLINGSPIQMNSAINNVLRMNWGDKALGTVKIIPEDISEDQKAFIRQVAADVLSGDPNLLGSVSDINQVFEQAGLPSPSDPLSSSELAVKMDGMVAKRVAVKGAGPGKPNPTQKKTLSRIAEFLETQHGMNGRH